MRAEVIAVGLTSAEEMMDDGNNMELLVLLWNIASIIQHLQRWEIIMTGSIK